jgi:hypothetical protein
MCLKKIGKYPLQIECIKEEFVGTWKRVGKEDITTRTLSCVKEREGR